MSQAIEKLFENMQRHREKFLERRQVFLWGAVQDDSAERITNDLLYLEMMDPGKAITFFINSPGGVVTSGMVVYDTMQMISSPVHTVCMGLAASMGSLLLSGGEKGKRSIFPSGRVMIHQPSIGGQGMYGQSSDIQIQAKQILKTKELGAKILADNCGKSLEQVMSDFDRDYWMNAAESKEYGIVDTIMDKIKF
ncbi:MAG: ATP-dependent Clp protease proteolytic subunit [Bdellovibrionales bacterium CG12_big_fil_rev_8_21_14_0_65_38_15]|nr:MAG: ATP-dependent Clp protease proteolytic subunit [Bdellovibrionales bacterium CG22_combo_CG10-13_8_21_14_all_38_13]PIQ57090.1 MAG: ATP-dependent Clp protease proteolytic subunit [Bdellovibrionales bacterium CG12_big_fil_rev_8_21_14_0_65_38_15]PIR30120.1 MAG: ATP-dependent Clp protease proteolytic subunit [Bdellovibrionales bacterium CG11_big_fil_rev_8_21_14_0_20_38_13]